MKNLAIVLSVLFLVILGIESVNAQNVQSATSGAAATIITPMTIVKNVDLNFGNIAVPSANGTVLMSPAGARTATNVILPSVTGVVTAANFTVTGLANATYVINLPASVTLVNGGNTMLVNAFTENATNILTGNTETFGVGATLNVAAGQATGEYTATFPVTVDYQ